MSKPTAPAPHELWRQAGGDRERYVELMREHGHIIDRQPGDDSPALSCGWRDRRGRDPFGLLTDEQYETLHDDLAEIAHRRRRAEAEAGRIVLP